MPIDTRDRNKYFNNSSISEFTKQYADSIRHNLSYVSTGEMDKAIGYLEAADRIFVCGNGGSASISEHLCCDMGKGTDVSGRQSLKVYSLVSNAAVLTAIANDMGYEKTFIYQLQMENLTDKDTVVLISSSGNSTNIFNAAKWAQCRGAKTIGLTGFDGGALAKIASASLHVPSYNYGVVEDCHQALMHIMAQYLYLKRK